MCSETGDRALASLLLDGSDDGLRSILDDHISCTNTGSNTGERERRTEDVSMARLGLQEAKGGGHSLAIGSQTENARNPRVSTDPCESC